MMENFREHAIACMMMAIPHSLPNWLVFNPVWFWRFGNAFTSYKTKHRKHLICWNPEDVPNLDMGFFRGAKIVDFWISDILPMPPEHNIWLGWRVVLGKGR